MMRVTAQIDCHLLKRDSMDAPRLVHKPAKDEINDEADLAGTLMSDEITTFKSGNPDIAWDFAAKSS